MKRQFFFLSPSSASSAVLWFAGMELWPPKIKKKKEEVRFHVTSTKATYETIIYIKKSQQNH
jgi:hypothetical protein